ncbi:MAG: short-chain dehydrogenase [marine bacterium B5-7]|nr:MAG: short-chain dehydrogenase [marine bacterium B5-7]
MSFDVKGKVALVTGANRGIGRAIVEGLLEAGASKVYAAVRNLDSVKPLVDKHGDRIVPLHIDLTKPETIKTASSTASDVELVINNAGILYKESPLSVNAIDALADEININVYGLIRMAQVFAPVFKANGGGAFVQLNSAASLRCRSDYTTYSASKAAAYSVTQGLREKLKEQGTQVLSVHPGPIATDMADTTGLADVAEPPSLVVDSIINGLKAGEFHVFPDSYAKQIGVQYQGFAKHIVEADLIES